MHRPIHEACVIHVHPTFGLAHVDVTDSCTMCLASPLTTPPQLTTLSMSSFHLPVACAICCDPFKVGDDARELPCGHFFDDHCIVTWLEEVRTLNPYAQ
jgi:Ring finger domain